MNGGIHIPQKLFDQINDLADAVIQEGDYAAGADVPDEWYDLARAIREGVDVLVGDDTFPSDES